MKLYKLLIILLFALTACSNEMDSDLETALNNGDISDNSNLPGNSSGGVPNIYCGLTNSSTGGASALSATKLTSGSTRTTTLSSGSNYFFFGASFSSTYTIAWSGNAYLYTVYKGVGNQHYYSYEDDDSTTISSYSGDVIIKFDGGDGNIVDFIVQEK
jgi:hypothetical protein